MILFPVWFFETLVLGGIALAGISGALLLGLLVRDAGGKKIW